MAKPIRTPIDKDNLVKMVKDHCSDALKNKTCIYRGSSTDIPENAGVLIDATNASGRQSVNTTNWYTVILDSNPYMSDFPKRSSSLICSTSIDYAGNFGNPLVILPFNGTPIGIVGEGHDIWETHVKIFKDTLYSLTSVNRGLDEISYRLEKLLGFKFEPSVESLMELEKKLNSNEAEQYMQIVKRAFGISVAISTYDDKIKNLMKTLYEAYAPHALNLILATPKDFDSKVSFQGRNLDESDSNEVWFAGKSIAMLPSTFEKEFK